VFSLLFERDTPNTHGIDEQSISIKKIYWVKYIWYSLWI